MMYRMVAAGVMIVGLASASFAADVTILVNPGPFPLDEAATSEAKVDWWDGDTTADTACTECFAAEELQRFLPGCTGVATDAIIVSADTELPKSGYVFILGTRASNPLVASLDPEGKALAPEAAESFRWRVIKEDARTVCVIEGSDRAGTLYGVYSYLEQLGIRFFGLGEKGTMYPAASVALLAEGDTASSPDFYTRGFWAWEDRGNDEFFYWMARNKMNFWTAYEKELHFCKKLGLKLTVGGHDLQYHFLDPKGEYPYNHPIFDGDDAKPADPYAAPPEAEYRGDADNDGKLTYFEAHPEWYGLYKGTRRGDIGPEFGTCNFCTSNNDPVTELSKNFVQALIDGDDYRYADIVNFWMLDCGKWCQCDACAAIGNLSDQLVTLIYKVRQAMNQAMAEGRLQRNVELVSLAYHETLDPPTKPAPADFDYRNCYFTYFPIERTYTHAMGDPASTEVNQRLKEAYLGWLSGANRNYKGDLCIGEYYNVSSIKSLPVVYSRIMAVDIPWYYRTGARHFQYMHVPTRLWGPWTLNQYLMGRLIWDHRDDSRAIVDEYFERYYPTATAEARAFYDHLERATANIKAYKHYIDGYSLRGALNAQSKNLFPKDTLQYDSESPALNAGISVVDATAGMCDARAALDAALLAATDPVEKERLLEDEARFAFGEAMYRFVYHMARTTLFHNRGDEALARREFVYVERNAELLRNMTDICQVSSSHASAPNGLVASQIEKGYNALKKTYGEQ
ncbi:MAG: DUF4838 domain-containing protein [bacterium]|nr:DUF4838 domain-containing protein [bacterium]